VALALGALFDPAINEASLTFLSSRIPETALLPATGQLAKKTIKAAPHGFPEDTEFIGVPRASWLDPRMHQEVLTNRWW
jgi:hypothetical protein